MNVNQNRCYRWKAFSFAQRSANMIAKFHAFTERWKKCLRNKYGRYSNALLMVIYRVTGLGRLAVSGQTPLHEYLNYSHFWSEWIENNSFSEVVVWVHLLQLIRTYLIKFDTIFADALLIPIFTFNLNSLKNICRMVKCFVLKLAIGF